MQRIMSVMMVIMTITIPLGLTACGGKEEDPNQVYLSDVNSAFADFGEDLSEIVRTIDAGNPNPVPFNKMSDEVDELVKDLHAITPPSAVKADHDKLVDRLFLYPMTLKVATGMSPEEFAATTSELSTEVRTIIATINRRLG